MFCGVVECGAGGFAVAAIYEDGLTEGHCGGVDVNADCAGRGCGASGLDILNQPRNGTYFRLLLAVTEVYGGKTVPSTSTSSSLQPASARCRMCSYCKPAYV